MHRSGPDLPLQEPQKRRKLETTPIKVSGIANTISKSWLESTFKFYGKVHSIEVNEGKNEKTACIHFSTREAAHSATSGMNGESVAGKVLSVELLQSQPDSSVMSVPNSPTHCRGDKVATSTTTDQKQLFSIKLTNIPHATLEATLYEKCRVLKGFTSLKLVQVREGPTNYAWVSFVNSCATVAQEALDGMTVDGNRIKAGQPRPCSRAHLMEQEPKSAMVSKPVPSKEFSFKLPTDAESPSTPADSSTIGLKTLPDPSKVDPSKPLSLSPKRTSSLFQPVRYGLALCPAMLSALPQEQQLSSKSSQGASTGGDQTKAAEPQKVASHSVERELAKVAGTESVAQARGMTPLKRSVESQKTPPPGARVGKATSGPESTTSTCTVQSTKLHARRAEHGSCYPPKQEQVQVEPIRTPLPALRHSQTQPLTLSEAVTLVSSKSTGGGQSPSMRVGRGSRTPSPTTETLEDNQPKGEGVNGSRSGSLNPFKRALASRPSPVQHLTKSSSFPRACVEKPMVDVTETCTLQSTKSNVRLAEHGSCYPPEEEQVQVEPIRTPLPALRHSQTQPLTLSEAVTLVSSKSTGGGQSPSMRVRRGSRTPSPTTETLEDNQPKGEGVNGTRSGSPNPFKRALARRPSPVQHLTKSSSFPRACVEKPMVDVTETCTLQSTKSNVRRAEHGSCYPPEEEQVQVEPIRTPLPALRHSQTQPLTLSEAVTLVSSKSTGGGQSPSMRVGRGSRTPSPTTVQVETLEDNQPKGEGVNGTRSGSPNPFKRALARRPSPVQHLTKSSSFPRARVKEPVADVAETVDFLDPLAKRIFITECESELNAIQKEYLVTIGGEEADDIALTLSCGNRRHLMTAKTEITARLQRVQASVSAHSFPISCCFLPCLADPDTLSLLQTIERQDTVEFSIVASTRQVKLPECSQELKSKLLECKTPLCLSSVPDYTEIRLGYFWKVINASTKEIVWFESDINDCINTAYIQRESMCSFEYKGHSYTVDFSLMTVSDRTSGGQAHDVVKDPVWCRYQDDEFGYEHMTEDISAIIERAFQQGIPGFVEIQGQPCVFDFSSDPMRALSKGMKEQSSVFIQRDPSPTSSEHVVTVRVRGIASKLSAAEERFRTALSSRVTTKAIDIPLKVNERVTQLLLLGMARQYCIQCTLSQDRQTLELTGSNEIVTNVKADLAQEIIKILSEIDAPSQCVFPSHWDHQTEDVVLCRVAEGSPEWAHVDKLMKESLTNVKIQTIERIQNKHLWQKYDFFRKKMEERTQGSGVNEKELFHGTRSNHPREIYESDKGFDFRFGSENSLWGQGTYFAVKASYSDRSYAYRPSGGQKQLILAKVVTGESIFMKQTEKLKVPPLKPGGKVERYDTVRANTGGSEIYVVYDHEKAYPAYLITYRN